MVRMNWVLHVAAELKRARAIHLVYAVVKGAIQDRRAVRTTARYRKAAERMGVLSLDEDETREAVLRRLATRGIQPKPKRKGRERRHRRAGR